MQWKLQAKIVLISHFCSHPLHVVITVGFKSENVLVNVNEGRVALLVELTGPELQTNIQVQFNFIPSTEQGLLLPIITNQ